MDSTAGATCIIKSQNETSGQNITSPKQRAQSCVNTINSTPTAVTNTHTGYKQRSDETVFPHCEVHTHAVQRC